MKIFTLESGLARRKLKGMKPNRCFKRVVQVSVVSKTHINFSNKGIKMQK